MIVAEAFYCVYLFVCACFFLGDVSVCVCVPVFMSDYICVCLRQCLCIFMRVYAELVTHVCHDMVFICTCVHMFAEENASMCAYAHACMHSTRCCVWILPQVSGCMDSCYCRPEEVAMRMRTPTRVLS